MKSKPIGGKYLPRFFGSQKNKPKKNYSDFLFFFYCSRKRQLLCELLFKSLHKSSSFFWFFFVFVCFRFDGFRDPLDDLFFCTGFSQVAKSCLLLKILKCHLFMQGFW